MGEAERLSEPLAIFSPARRPRQSVGEVRYQQMLALKEAGLSTGSIAKRLGVGQRTIQRWLALQHGPYAGARKPRRSPLDWSTRYLRERWEAGERNGTVLWEELKEKGYTGSPRSVYRRLAKWREHPQKRELPTPPEPVPYSPFEDVTEGEDHWVDASPDLPTCNAVSCQPPDQTVSDRSAAAIGKRERPMGVYGIRWRQSSE